MKLILQIEPLKNFPTLMGAHELAWSYLSDAIFADAYHAGLAELHIFLPNEALCSTMTLRAKLSQGNANSEFGAALLNSCNKIPQNSTRLYLLQFGLLAPSSLRNLPRPTLENWESLKTMNVYTLTTKVWGGAMFLSTKLKRPDFYDKASFAMRPNFASECNVPAYYQLSIWKRSK